MSVRLSVVLCQSAGGTAARRDLEGDLVAQLIGAPGLDLSLVGPIEHLDPGGTDQLLLGGLLSDLAILTWFPPDEALAFCHQAGVRGFRARHSLDDQGATSPPNQPSTVSLQQGPLQQGPLQQLTQINQPGHHSPAGAQATDARKLYFFDLSSHMARGIVAGLQGLLQARRTPTVSISMAGKPAAMTGSARPTAVLSADPSAVDPNTTEAGNTVSESQSTEALRTALPGGRAKSQEAEVDQSEPPDQPLLRPQNRQPIKTSGTTEWDQLVEELNDLDI